MSRVSREVSEQILGDAQRALNSVAVRNYSAGVNDGLEIAITLIREVFAREAGQTMGPEELAKLLEYQIASRAMAGRTRKSCP